MDDLSMFKNITNDEIDFMLKCFHAIRMTFKKERTIISSIINSNYIGVILSGTAHMVKYDYKGNRTILEKLERDSTFGNIFMSLGNDISITATTDCDVLLIEYSHVYEQCRKNCRCHTIFTSNILELLSKKVSELNDRLEVLSNRSIRDKLLSYFGLLVKGKSRRSFILPFSYTELADYLSVDRSAMQRELKNLKDEGFITTNGKRITLNY
ncbi:MAG: Crp/Fnr family transcriptional regulator [Bacilli bacterium]|nr:Crp/Fnr family transcriptional regulator [Bacilli bacterium]